MRKEVSRILSFRHFILKAKGPKDSENQLLLGFNSLFFPVKPKGKVVSFSKYIYNPLFRLFSKACGQINAFIFFFLKSFEEMFGSCRPMGFKKGKYLTNNQISSVGSFTFRVFQVHRLVLIAHRWLLGKPNVADQTTHGALRNL